MEYIKPGAGRSFETDVGLSVGELFYETHIFFNVILQLFWRFL